MAHRSEVREAAGIFFVFIRNEENRLLEFIIVEFLKCDGCRDRGENRDVCERWERIIWESVIFFDWSPQARTHRNSVGGRNTHPVWLESPAEVSSEQTLAACWSAWMGRWPPIRLVAWRQRNISQHFSDMQTVTKWRLCPPVRLFYLNRFYCFTIENKMERQRSVNRTMGASHVKWTPEPTKLTGVS